MIFYNRRSFHDIVGRKCGVAAPSVEIDTRLFRFRFKKSILSWRLTNFKQKWQTPSKNVWGFWYFFALSLFSVDSSIIQQRWASSVLFLIFSPTLKKNLLWWKGLRDWGDWSLVITDHGHDDFDDHDDFDACDAVRWRCMKELMREKLTGEVPDKMMDMQRSEPILEAKNNSRSAWFCEDHFLIYHLFRTDLLFLASKYLESKIKRKRN